MQQGQAVVRSKRYGSFTRLASLSVVWQIINMATPLAYAWVILRRGGAQVYGSYSTVFAIVAVAMCVSEFGYQSHGIRKMAESETVDKAKTFSTIVCAKLLLCVVIFPVYVIASYFVLKGQASIAIMATAYSYLIGQAISPLWHLYAEGKLGGALYITGITRLVGMAVLFYTTRDGVDLFWVVSNNALTNLTVGMALLWYSYGLLGKNFAAVSFAEIRNSLVESFPLFVSNAGVALYTSLNVIAVNVILGSVAAGYFSIAERVVKSAQSVFSGLSASALALKARQAPASKEEFSNANVLLLQGVLLGITTVIIIGFSGSIVTILGASPSSAQLVAQLLRIYSVVLLIGGMSSALNAQILIAAGRYSNIARVVGAAGILNIIMIFTLTKILGVHGAVFSVVMVEAFILLATIYMTTRMGGPLKQAVS